MKRIVGFIAGLLVVSLVWQCSQSREVSLRYIDAQDQSYMLYMPVRDKKKLTAFMQILFAEDSFGYTILGSKPLSWVTYRRPLPLSSWAKFCDAFSTRNRTLRSGWKTWEKYQHLFPSTQLVIEHPKCHPDVTSILIINMDKFDAVVNENKVDFQEVLGREITSGLQLFNEARGLSLINEVLEGHQALLGIVLGYGRDNSWQFHEGCKSHTAIGCVWGDEENFMDEESFSSDLKTTDYYLLRYSCPSFAGDPDSDESQALKAEYLFARQTLVEYYREKDFLEATLSLLAGHNP